MKTINQKIEKVKEILKDKKVAISFSGGADSTLLAYLAKDVCKDLILITYNNCIMPTNFVEFTKEKASELKINHEIIENDFINIDNFVENSHNRCYVCRKLMYDTIKQVANDKGYQIIIDGTNISDLIEDRPGILINYMYEIQSPFIEAKLESDEIHKYLKDNKINYSKATTCLATRIKTGEEITADKINRIRYSEDIIKNITNSDEIRLREENNIGTIEIENIRKIIDLDKINTIKDELKLMNYDKLLLNINYENKKSKLIEFKEDKINNTYAFEKDLPYKIDLDSTKEKLESLSNSSNSSNNNNHKDSNIIKTIRYLEDIGFITLELNINSNTKPTITIFKTGKITGKDFNSKEDAKNAFIIILQNIRREKIE